MFFPCFFIQCLNILWACGSGFLGVTGGGGKRSPNHFAPCPSPALPLQKGAQVWWGDSYNSWEATRSDGGLKDFVPHPHSG